MRREHRWFRTRAVNSSTIENSISHDCWFIPGPCISEPFDEKTLCLGPPAYWSVLSVPEHPYCSLYVANPGWA